MDLSLWIRHLFLKNCRHEYQSDSSDDTNISDLLLPSRDLRALKQAAQDDNLKLMNDFFGNHHSNDINLICDSEGSTLLHIAAGYGSHSIVDYLIERKIEINARDKHGAGALAYACAHGRSETAKKLIGAGADVNLADLSGHTPLYFAVKKMHRATIKLLLHHGANPKVRSMNGNNCFDQAKQPQLRDFIRNHYLAYKLRVDVELNLIDAIESDLNEIDKYGEAVDRAKIITTKINNSSLTDSAVKYLLPTEIATLIKRLRLSDEVLIEVYFEIVLKGDGQLEIIQLLTVPALLSAKLRSSGDITALHRAAGHNYIQIATYLLQQNADPNATDANGVIPLHNAAHYGHLEMVELLLKYGSNINKADNTGFTPLHEASKESKPQICIHLVSAGADLHFRDCDGKTPYEVATAMDIKYLLKADTTLPDLSNLPEDEIYLDIENIRLDEDPDELVDDYADSEFDNRLMIYTESVANLINNPNNRDKVKLIPIKPTDEKYDIIRTRMNETIVFHDNGPIFTHYYIIRIREIFNDRLFHDYKYRRQAIKEGNNGSANERLLFHGSPEAQSVVSRGFDESYASFEGMFGAGLYFAHHSSKSNQYTFGLNKPCRKHEDSACHRCLRHLLLCQVALGRTLKIKQVSKYAHAPPGHHSISALPDILGIDNLAYPEYVIYEGKQAYPLYLIEYTIAS